MALDWRSRLVRLPILVTLMLAMLLPTSAAASVLAQVTPPDGGGAPVSPPPQASAGSQASAYLAYRNSTASCTAWSPLFMKNADGWNSTIVIRNQNLTSTLIDPTQGTPPITIEFHLRPLGVRNPIDPLIVRSRTIPQFGLSTITAADLALPDGFRGSLVAIAKPSGTAVTGTSNPCAISAVTYHDAPGRNRITLESPEVADTALVIPLAYNDYNGWQSMVVVQNTSPDSDATVLVDVRGTGVDTYETSVTVARESSVLLDLSMAPKGALTVEIQDKVEIRKQQAGAGGVGKIVAAAYHLGPRGIAAGNNGVAASRGVGRVFVPLLYRAYNGYDSAVRVVNIVEGTSQPTITFYDRDTNDRIGSITTERPLGEGEEITIYLPALEMLQDNKVYSAVIETTPPASVSAAPATSNITLPSPGPQTFPPTNTTLTAIVNHVNRVYNTAMLYSAASFGDTSLTAPIVYRSRSGLNSGIQIQNLTGVPGTSFPNYPPPSLAGGSSNTPISAVIIFRNQAGTSVTSIHVTVPAFGSTTVYLPDVPDLPDNFIGSAEITTSAPTAATVNAVRYVTPATTPPE